MTEPEMHPMTPTVTPEKRKRSVTSGSTPHRPPKMARLDPLAPTVDETPESTIHYGVYMHDLLKESGNATPKLITVSADFTSAYEAMRKHATGNIEANVHWGATKELNTNNLYEILDSRNHVRLRYELDAVSPVGQDANGVQVWERVSASPAQSVHYGMYIDLHCDVRNKAEQFFIGGFKSLGEASHAMKQSAAVYLHGHGETKLYGKSIEVMNGKGQLQRRFTIVKCRLGGNGSFLKGEGWPLEQESTGSKVPVICLPTPETSKPSEPPAALTTAPQIVTKVARKDTPQVVQKVPTHVLSEPQAVQSTRRQPKRHQTPIPPANNTRQKQPKTGLRATSKAPAKSATTAKPKPQTKTQVQALHDPNLYCTCRLPDDGSLMICCDNENCPISWYHGRCINIHKTIPEDEEWYCDLCTQEQENKEPRGMNTSTGKMPGKKGGRSGAKAKGKAKKGKLS
ncbi:hypothetical protein ACET3X_009240 [Alternaria dauci]|uniref:PHD-type domain-containing protein n=1 Tax=Alternaria dauci TaxID=48095 RepID=A0ABR3U9S6_9PLEO